MKNSFNIFMIGLTTGLFLQLAIGPIFFFVVNLALQKAMYDGLTAVLAVTLVDYFFITLSVVGIGKLLEKIKTKIVFGIISSIVLIVFGILLIKGILDGRLSSGINIESHNTASGFLSAFILTISNPITIVFFTSLFTAKAVEYNYTKSNLYIFGFAVGLATLIFMGTSVILFSLLKGIIPTLLIQKLNLIVGLVLVCYGIIRIVNLLKLRNQMCNY